MGEEYAIICTYQDGDISVHYVEGTKEKALEIALGTWRTACPESLTIAQVCGYMSGENVFELL